METNSEPGTATASSDEHYERLYLRWATGIGAFSVLVFTWMVTLGRWDLFAQRPYSAMLDVQTRAMMDGHLWVPEGSLGFEGFIINDRTYAYFGLFPSLLRIPIFLLTDRFDGRLSTVSMIAAFAIAYAAVALLIARVRRLGFPDGWSRSGLTLALIALATLGLGSNLMYMATAAWVYHEAILWGVAGVLAAFAAIARWLRTPTSRHLAVAGAWTTVAWMSRGSVGLGPTLALGMIGVSALVPNRFTQALAPTPPIEGSRFRTAAMLFAAGAVGALCFAGVNMAKFGSPAELPMDKQIQSINPLPSRRAAMDAYGGTIFSPRLAPAVIVQSLRPDLLAPTSTWPFVQYTRVEPPAIGGVVFDTVEPSAGLTLTHPLFLALAAVGVGAMIRRRASNPGLSALRPLVIGSAIGAGPVLTIAFISQRYITDLLPPVLVAAAAGVAVLNQWSPDKAASAEPANPTRHRLVIATSSVLAAVGIFITLATTWTYQRFENPPDAEARRSWVRAAISVSDKVGAELSFERADSIKDLKASAGTLLVVGDCAGLYVGQSDGVWTPIEASVGAGVPMVRVDGRPPEGTSGVQVGSVGDLTIELVSVDANTVRVDLIRGNHVERGTPFEVSPGPIELAIDLDANLPTVQVRHGDNNVALLSGPPPDAPFVVGPGTSEVTVTEVDAPTPICDALTNR